MDAGLLKRSWEVIRRQVDVLLIWVIAGAVLLAFGLYRYLLFHSLVEMFSIVIAFSVFVLTWNARQNLRNGYLLIVGISLLFVSMLDLLHTLAYQGMGVFEGTGLNDPNGANLATQLWVAARYLQGLSMVAAPFFAGLAPDDEWRAPAFARRSFNPRALMLVYAGLTGLILLSIFAWDIFPTAFAGGLTPFKRISEFIIILLFLVGIGLLLSIRKAFPPLVARLLLASMAVTVVAEFAFTEYVRVIDWVNMAGHFLKVIAFFLVYKAIIDIGFRTPQELLFRELAQSEQAMREISARERDRAAQLKAVMDAVPAVVWIAHDPGAKYVAGNQAASQILRMPAGANLSKTAPEGEAPSHFRVFHNGKELAPEELPLQVSAASGQPVRDFEETIVFNDGDECTLFGNVTPLKDEAGQPAGAVAAFIDITARVRAEQALQESEQRYRSLFESMEEGFVLQEIVFDEQGSPFDFRIVELNPAFERMTGLSREKAVGLTIRELLENLPLEWLEHYTSAARSGEPQRFEIHSPELDRYFEILLYRTRPDQIATLTIDTTVRRKGETAVKEYATQLEQSNRELQDFAFVASHDLQEPLRKIQAFGERLKAQVDDQLDEEARDYLGRMLNASQRMRTMINDLLSLSRVTTRGQPFERVDLNEVARDVLSDLDLRIERTGAQVEMEVLPVIEADPVQMHQLLQNLVVNALKYHKPGSPPQVRLYSECMPERHQVIIIVEDRGIGFDEQYLDRIFQPFQRLHGRSEFEGSGIGLAVCRKIAERHGGTITARSVIGQGSSFIVTLPDNQSPFRSI